MKIFLDPRTDRVRLVANPTRPEPISDDDSEDSAPTADRLADLSRPDPLQTARRRIHPRFPESGNGD